MPKVWKEIASGGEWIGDTDLKDFFGLVDHEKLLTLVARRVGDKRVLKLIRAFLNAGVMEDGLVSHEKLKLKVNPERSAVARRQERNFLGFSFTWHREPRRRIASKALARVKPRVRELTCRTRGVSLESRVAELRTYFRGWRSYFGFCHTPGCWCPWIRGPAADCGR